MDEDDIEGFYKAKIQILEHQLHHAASLRDGYKMQLDAANKENIELRKNIKNKNEQTII